MSRFLIAVSVVAVSVTALELPIARAAVAPAPTVVATIAPAAVADADAEGVHDFGSGSWGVPDGGSSYLGQTTKNGQVKVNNNGPGRVSVHLISPWGITTVIHLPPGAQLCRKLAPGRGVEVHDGGKDGLGANGTCVIP
ncbi:MAG: hypothetical protein FJ293_07085 [Planctomycetes bacterium]|nr:hypothetical protein [Planctomycetota bacterium]